jgi:hypothetical protein
MLTYLFADIYLLRIMSDTFEQRKLHRRSRLISFYYQRYNINK